MEGVIREVIKEENGKIKPFIFHILVEALLQPLYRENMRRKTLTKNKVSELFSQQKQKISLEEESSSS